MDNIQLLNLILIIVIVVLVELGGIAILLIYRMKNKENTAKKEKEEMQIAANGGDPKKIPPTAMTRNGVGIKSIYEFMEFDEVKDGMIVRFEVTSGVKMVKEFDYVKKGDLLVSDTLITSSEESKYIGAYGSVYAYTWYNVESSYAVKNNKKIDELEIYNLLLEDNRAKIDKELTGNDEFLVKEQILSFKNDNNKYRLKIHYTLLEDITL